MGKRPSIIHAALTRLDAKMAIGESRFAAKVAARAVDPALWAVSTGYIHSFGTRSSYQQHVLAFVNWCRDAQDIRLLEQMDARANELATQYLSERVARGQSAYTLQSLRSALRLFFDDRTLAADLPLPRRLRAHIRRSRHAVQRDKDFQPAHWQPLITFLRATGLRRAEVSVIRVRDVRLTDEGRAEVAIYCGKGGRPRRVVARAGHEEAVMRPIEGRDPDARVFPRIPSHLDVHALRREFAQGLYQELSGRPLPLATGRLRRDVYDAEAVALVSQALGHNRLDVVLNHYLI